MPGERTGRSRRRLTAAELVLRCERATALAMADAPKSKSVQNQLSGSVSGGFIVNPPEKDTRTLSEVGISKHRAHSLRQLAKVDDAKFEALIEQGNAAG